MNKTAKAFLISAIMLAAQGASAGGIAETLFNKNQYSGNPNDSCPSQGTENPIHIATRNKYHEEVLYKGAGQFPLEFKLHYNSRH